MNHYPRHIGDIARDTAHLSQGQFGAYDLLMDWYYSNEKPLPLDPNFLYAITRARDKKERANTDSVMAWFFVKQDDGWHQKRCDEELQKYREKSAKASQSASTRWSNSQSERNANAYANASKTHTERIPERNASQEPLKDLKENTKTDKPGANAPVFADDPCAKVFSDGVALLTACGDSERNARSYLGKLRKDHGDEAVLSALQRAKDGAVSDPKGFLAGALRPKGARLAL